MAVPAGRLPGGRRGRTSPPTTPRSADPTADGRRTTAKPLFRSRGRNARGPPLPRPKRPAGSPKEHAALRPAAAGPRRPPTAHPPDRAAPGPRRPPGARACPAAPRRGSGSTAGSAGRGEPTEGGEGERHGRTRASDGRGDGNGPRKAPHPGTERPLGRRTDTRGKPTGITPPRDFLGQSRHACGTDPARNRRPPGEPGKTQHGRLPTPPPPPKTLEREWAPTRPATRRGRPTVVPQRPHAPEREVDPARPGSPAPRRGNRSPVVPNRGNAAGEGGERGDSTTPQHKRQRATRHTRHVRVAGTAKTGTRGRGPHAAGRRGEHVGEGDGWDPGSPPTTHSPTHPFRSTSSRGDPPQNHEKSPGSKHAGMTMALAPRDPPSDSERGGAGRGRPKEHKHSGSPGDGRRGTPGQSYAHRAVGAGGRSRGTVRERTPTRPREHAPSSDR